MNIFIIPLIIISVLTPVFFNIDIIDVEAFSGGKVVLENPQVSENGGFDNALPAITAKAAIVADGRTGEILYSKNMATKIPLASLTKLMSFYVLFNKNLNQDEMVEINNEDTESLKDFVNPGDVISSLGVSAGSKIKISDLFSLGLIKSANDAVAMLVKITSPNFYLFAKEMNKRALEFGMYSTYFDEPTGLSVNNISTAGDLVLLALNIFENSDIKEITSKESYKIDGMDMRFDSTDRLFELLEGTSYKIIAGKTGYLDESGYNFLVEVENGEGKKYIIVVLGSATSQSRFEDAYKLLLWAEQN